MDDILYNSFMKRLNDICKSSRPDDVSPTSGSDSEKSESVPPFITENMKFDTLSENDRYLVHALLHTFYGCGGNKNLSVETIEKLHSNIKLTIKHEDFDRLDRKNDKNKWSINKNEWLLKTYEI